MIHRIITYYNTKSKIVSTNNLKTLVILISFPRKRESIAPQNFLDILCCFEELASQNFGVFVYSRTSCTLRSLTPCFTLQFSKSFEYTCESGDDIIPVGL